MSIPHPTSDWMLEIDNVNDMADMCEESELKEWSDPIKTLSNFCNRMNVGKYCRILAIADDVHHEYQSADFFAMVPAMDRKYVELDEDQRVANIFAPFSGRVSSVACNTIEKYQHALAHSPSCLC